MMKTSQLALGMAGGWQGNFASLGKARERMSQGIQLGSPCRASWGPATCGPGPREKCLRSWNDGSPEDVFLRWGPQEEGLPCSCLRTWGEGGCINDALQLPVGFVMVTPEPRGVPRKRRVALLRTGCGICGAQCKKNIQGPCSKMMKNFKRVAAER